MDSGQSVGQATNSKKAFSHTGLKAMMIKGDPYDFPFDRDLRPANTALLVIDMQFDFCGEVGYVDKMGYDISLTRAALAPACMLIDSAVWRVFS